MSIQYPILDEYPVLVDVSIWQGIMNWIITAKKVVGAYIRAGSITADGGVLYTDNQFKRNSEIAPDLLPTGFFWYFRPNYEPIKQANYFCDLIEPISWKLKPAMDLEVSGGMTQSTISGRAKKFVDRVKALLGVSCVIYTRGSFWNPYVGNPAWAAGFDLWAARYAPYLTSPWSDGLYRPLTWENWKLWQVLADGDFLGAEYGASSPHIDVDLFNGTKEEFAAWAGLESAPPAPLPLPVPVPAQGFRMRVMQDGLRVRSGPGTSFAQVGSLNVGDIVEVLNVGGAGAWVEIRPGQWANAQLNNDRNMEPA